MFILVNICNFKFTTHRYTLFFSPKKDDIRTHIYMGCCNFSPSML